MRLPAFAPGAWPGLRLAVDPREAATASAWAPFFPEVQWSAPADAAAWLCTIDAPPPTGRATLRAAPGPWPWAHFGARRGRAALIAWAVPEAGLSSPAMAVPSLAGDSLADSSAILSALRAARVAGPVGWPDPGPAGLGCTAGEAVLVLDPCRPEAAAPLAAMWRAAEAAAAGRPLRAIRLRDAPSSLPGAIGPFAAWTLIEAASAWWQVQEEGLGSLAAAAGVAVHGAAPGDFATLLAASRFADPFRAAPCSALEAITLMEAWARVADENRRIAVACGMAWWKRARIGEMLASPAGEPAFHRTARRAVATAQRQGGAIAVWATRIPKGLPARAAAAGVPVIAVEDGFLRSAGLGAGFLPGGSIALDRGGPAYDPSRVSDLEHLLATAAFSPALLARAAMLRARLVAGGVTKYNLSDAAAPPPVRPGRLRVLVPGQVEDDASVRQGAMAGPRSNLDLLRAARAAAGDAAFLLYRPHPDVVAGYRRGHVPAAEAARLADAVQADAGMPALLDWADHIHTMTSLTGFEALLRGKAVTCHGLPFYAGWGLTDDRQKLPRRERRLTLDALVAGVLILYPRYLDPVTRLPCPVEVLVERLARPELWAATRLALLRRWQGRLLAALGRRGWLA